MNIPREILLLLVRHGLSGIGVVLMWRGWLTHDDVAQFEGAANEIAGALCTLFALGWSVKRKMDRAPKAEAAK